jgi:hypothetical protein
VSDGAPDELGGVPLNEGSTDEERARLAAARAHLDSLDLPEGVEVSLGFVDPDALVDQIDADDAAVFAPADAFTFRRHKGVGFLPTIELSGLEWMEAAIRAGTLSCGVYGIGNEIEGADVGLFAHLRLRVGVKETPLYVMLDAASEDWTRWAMRRFALAFPADDAGVYAWIATGPLTSFPDGFVLPGKLGRNDPCPCGSGKKAKKCCLA